MGLFIFIGILVFIAWLIPKYFLMLEDPYFRKKRFAIDHFPTCKVYEKDYQKQLELYKAKVRKEVFNYFANEYCEKLWSQYVDLCKKCNCEIDRLIIYESQLHIASRDLCGVFRGGRVKCGDFYISHSGRYSKLEIQPIIRRFY